MFTVCITSNDDGTYGVYSESAADESAEGTGQDQMGQPNMQPQSDQGPSEQQPKNVATVKEAFMIALEMLKNKGAPTDTAEQQRGFEQVAGVK
jgi:hypothetical protein